MPRFISDDEMAKSEEPPKKRFISDAEMAKSEGPKSPFDLKQPFSTTDAPENIQTGTDYLQSVREGIPLSEIGRKMDRATDAGLDTLIDGRPFMAGFNQRNADAKAESATRHQRSPTASTAGNVTGALVAPIGGLAMNAGINIADASSRADSPEEALKNGVKAGGVSAAMSAIPGLGWVANKAGGKISKGADFLEDKIGKKLPMEWIEKLLKKADEVPKKPLILDHLGLPMNAPQAAAKSSKMGNVAVFGAGAALTPGDLKTKLKGGAVAVAGKNVGKIGDIMQKVGSLPMKYQNMLVGTPQQIELTHYLLQKEDPEYNKLINAP